MLAAWLSKTSLVSDVVASADPFDTSWFAWMDVTGGRFKQRNRRWDIMALDFTEKPGMLHHFASGMVYRNQKVPLSAALLLGDKETWARVQKRHLQESVVQVSSGYPHDEETIFGEVYAQESGMFLCIPQHYQLCIPQHYQRLPDTDPPRRQTR